MARSARFRMVTGRSDRLLALLSGSVLFAASTGRCEVSFDELRKQHPDFARLLTLAAPESGLLKEQLNQALDDIAKWALQSTSQAVGEMIGCWWTKGGCSKQRLVPSKLGRADSRKERAQR